MKKIPMLEKFAAQSLVEYDGELIFSKEKFAELIVGECINEIAYIGKANEVFGDRTDRGGLNHILWTTETAIEMIKQHFGVEE
jgi:hypothetical protein